HRSTIVFANSRRLAERLTARLNAAYHEAQPDDPAGVIARTHHGSIAKGVRAEVEAELKAGRLPCVVATNSLELGIDMGAVDLVIQVGAPPSVASGLQRIGRGGHQVEAVSHGVLFPLSRSDLLTTAVVTERMELGQIERAKRLRNPLDVLAQQLVSMCLDATPAPETLLALVRGADAFADLPDPAFWGVVDMLTGKYPADEFTGLRPRLTWDRVAGTLAARPGARRLVTTSGGTIPDRGLYGVFMPGTAGAGAGKHAASRRVGELDEEMVYESRVGDVFTLGTSAWRIDEITPNQVIVTPQPGQAGRVPFWHGDEMSRPAAVGRAIQARVADLGRGDGAPDTHLDPAARANLERYIRDQRAATGVLPDAQTIIIEYNQDDMGAWRACLHCQLGRAVLHPWSLAIAHRLRETGADPRVILTDDGIVIRLGEVGDPSIGSVVAVDPAEIDQIVTAETTRSALFAAHFRQCAARALLLPRRDPGQRSPLWQQRLRSAQLLGVAAGHPDFPVIAEALRECLDDVFDLATLRAVLGDIAARRVRIVEVTTPRPSPFAQALLFGYTGLFLYDADQPLAERAAHASLVDPALLASLLGHPGGEIADEAGLAAVEASLQRLTHPVRSLEALWDLLREIGPLTAAECAGRSAADPAAWLAELQAARRIVAVPVGGHDLFAVAADEPLLASAGEPASLDRLIRRWVRTHAVVTPAVLARRYGVRVDAVTAVLDRLCGDGSLERGQFTEGPGPQYIASDTLARARRRTLTRLRAQIAPVAPQQYASFLTRWQELDQPGRGPEALLAAVDQLAGYPLPASMLESVILPARVADYAPSLLDRAMLAGEVTWSGHGPIGEADGWVALWPADLPRLLPPLATGLSPDAQRVLDRLGGGGAWTTADRAADDLPPSRVEAAVWELVWAGWVSTDTLEPLRALGRGGGALRRPYVPRTRRVGPVRPVLPRRSSGRWFAVDAGPPSETARLATAVGLELARYGVLTKGAILSEALTPRFFDAYQVLAGLEGQGSARRGYFVDGLGAAQFALPGAVDRLREPASSGLVLLAAPDPANPWGAGLAWPISQGHRPTRTAGAIVVLDDGWPVVYIERGAHTLVSFHDDPAAARAALALVGEWIDRGRRATDTLTRINATPAFEARDWAPVLDAAGFTMVPQGFRRRALP
ncbi:MAG: DEAD/DEAH box helicase, partial [Propionibacteriaceae bacterium]|nr:DEAD/DEAH box helicase [Propionibacteriaceae bacterium]